MNKTKHGRTREGENQKGISSYVNLSRGAVSQKSTFPTIVFDALPNQVRGHSGVTFRRFTNTYGTHPVETHTSNVASREFFMPRPCGAGRNPNRNNRVSGFYIQNKFGGEILNLIPSDLPSIKRIDDFETSLGDAQRRPLENYVTNQIRKGDPESSFDSNDYFTCNKRLNAKPDCKDVKETCNDNALYGPKFLHSVHVATSLRNSEYIHG